MINMRRCLSLIIITAQMIGSQGIHRDQDHVVPAWVALFLQPSPAAIKRRSIIPKYKEALFIQVIASLRY